MMAIITKLDIIFYPWHFIHTKLIPLFFLVIIGGTQQNMSI